MATTENPANQQEHEVQEVLERYRTAPERALQERDDGIRAIANRYGLKQVEVIRLTGYSRETVRRILRPDTRATVRQARLEAEKPAQ
jgi:hypothetical protein